MGEKPPINIDTQPLADVANNLIDKIADVVGWIAKPSDKKLYRRRAEQYFIEEIENLEGISPIAKAAYMSNIRKIIKEYTNQNEIIQMALEQLNDKANPKGIDDDWLMLFFDFCKNASNEDIKCIWAKVLAEECNNNGFITKRLLSILQIISKQEATAFNNILKFLVKCEIEHGKTSSILLIYKIHLDCIYEKNGLKNEDLRMLDSIGLIQLDKAEGFFVISRKKNVTLTYFDKKIIIESCKKIPIGIVHLTREGEILAQILSVSNKVSDFPQYIYYVLSTRVERVRWNNEIGYWNTDK